MWEWGLQRRSLQRRRLRRQGKRFPKARRVLGTWGTRQHLGDLSHFDVIDASQGFSVWTEEVLGLGKSWYFVIPNVCGLRPDTKTKFRGMAVKLDHGMAISWDGRLIRHCMSVSCPDGIERGFVTKKRESPFRNHLTELSQRRRKKLWRRGTPDAQKVLSCLCNDGLQGAAKQEEEETPWGPRIKTGGDVATDVDCPPVEFTSFKPAAPIRCAAGLFRRSWW